MSNGTGSGRRVPKYVKEYDSNWEPEVAKLPVVISFPGTELKSRDVVVGLEIDGDASAYPWDTLVKQSPIQDRLGGNPILVVAGPGWKVGAGIYSAALTVTTSNCSARVTARNSL